MSVNVEREDGSQQTYVIKDGDGEYYTLIDEPEAKCVIYIARLGVYTSFDDIKGFIRDDEPLVDA